MNLKRTEIRLIVPHKALGIYNLMAVKGVVNWEFIWSQVLCRPRSLSALCEVIERSGSDLEKPVR